MHNYKFDDPWGGKEKQCLFTMNNVSEDFFWMESIISHHGSMSYLYNELAYGSLCNSIFYNSWFM